MLQFGIVLLCNLLLMFIDSLFVILIISAFIKGYTRGLIVAIFSSLAILIGIVAAIKLSAVVANYLYQNAHLSMQWLPIISFTLVMFAVILGVRLLAKMLQKTVEFALMGWVNKAGGILLYICIYITLFSVFIFYLEKMSLLSQPAIADSKFYPFVQPWGPKAVNGFGYVVPLFKGLFTQLEYFFTAVNNKAA
jgi:membrane protein required for colicin V production